MYGLLGSDNIWTQLFENLESEGAKISKYCENHLLKLSKLMYINNQNLSFNIFTV